MTSCSNPSIVHPFLEFPVPEFLDIPDQNFVLCCWWQFCTRFCIVYWVKFWKNEGKWWYFQFFAFSIANVLKKYRKWVLKMCGLGTLFILQTAVSGVAIARPILYDVVSPVTFLGNMSNNTFAKDFSPANPLCVAYNRRRQPYLHGITVQYNVGPDIKMWQIYIK